MSRLRVALIGCGRIAYKHIEALSHNYNFAQLVAVCDLIEERAHAKKQQYQQQVIGSKVKVYTDYEAMLTEETLDMVVIATESGHHALHALKSLEKDCHVLIEKPMALSVADADEIIQVAKEKKKKVGVVHQNRFNPCIQKLRRALEEGRFGKIIHSTARILWNRDEAYYQQAPWRGTKAMDGGTLMNQCIHNIDLLLWMMGSEVERIHIERDTFLRNIEMEDFGAILLRFKNKAIGVIEGSACVFPQNLEETLSIFGEKGTVVVGGLALNEIKTWLFEDQRPYDSEKVNSKISNVYGFGHTALYKDFIEAIYEDRAPLVTGEEGKKAMALILKAYELSMEG